MECDSSLTFESVGGQPRKQHRGGGPLSVEKRVTRARGEVCLETCYWLKVEKLRVWGAENAGVSGNAGKTAYYRIFSRITAYSRILGKTGGEQPEGWTPSA